MATQPDRAELRTRDRTLRRTCEIVADTDRSFAEKVDALFERVREALGTEYATLSRVHEDAGEYIFERVAAPDGVDLEPGDRTALADLPNCRHVVETEQTLVLHDVAARAPELVDPAWGIACYLGAPVVVDDEVYGTFCFYDDDAREAAFSAWEVQFVDLLSEWVGYELERQRYLDRVTALGELTQTARDVTDTVTGQSDREAIEGTACRSLAAADSYRFAWTAEAAPETDALRVRTAAGVDGILADRSFELDPETGRPAPPVRALRDAEAEVERDAHVDASHDGWQAHAQRFDYAASASVPVGHEGVVYGVLTVHADRPDAFTGRERAAVTHIGELLGHAVAASERRRALTSDAVLEVTFGIADALAEWGFEDPPAETVLLHEVVTTGDGTVLTFGTTSRAGLAAVRPVAAEMPTCEGVTRTFDRGEDVAFELAFTEMPVVTRLSALGGRVDQVLLEGGDVRLTAQFPPDVDVRRALEAVRETYPGADIVAKREVTRSGEFDERVRAAFTGDLTDRQLEALRTAYFAGYFERPRGASGEDVAGRLGVSNSTFSQHLRAAQRKLLGELFGEAPTT